MRYVYFCTVLLFGGPACRGGEVHVITVGSADYHQSRLKLVIPVLEPGGGDALFGETLVEMDFVGNYEIPRLPVPPEAIKAVTVKSRYVSAAAAAGPDGFNLSLKMEHALPSPEFASPSITENNHSSSALSAKGVISTVGPAVFTSDAPERFSGSSEAGTVSIPVKAYLVALGSHATGDYDTYSARFSLCFHQSPLLEVTYELNDGFTMEAAGIPTSSQVVRSWGSVQAPGPIAAPDVAGFPFPGELTGQSVAQKIELRGPKKFDLLVNGLPGYRYSLVRSLDLVHPAFVEAKEGNGEILRFEIDESSQGVTSAFFQVQASKIASP